MSRHYSDEALARYAEGDLSPRKSARIASHLTGCPMCRERVRELESVPNLLASVQFPPIPEQLSARIEMAIAGESAARVATAPASEAGRRDLPARARPTGRGWRLPSMGSPTMRRALVAAGAAVVVVAGGYEIATHVTGAGPSSSAGSIARSASGGSMRLGRVSYTQHGRPQSINVTKSGTNFIPATLQQQTEAVIARTTASGQASKARPAPLNQTATKTPFLPLFTGPDLANLQACVGRIAAGNHVLLVDVATYQGAPATIIAVQSEPSGSASVFAVGEKCSAHVSDILAHQALQR